MKTKLIKIIAVILAIFGLASLSAPTYADNNICNAEGVSDEVKAASGCPDYTVAKAENVIIAILNVVIGLMGIVAVVFVIIGGVQYMTSTGDPGKVKKAKDTILYAIIGLIIVAFSFAIVNFVIANIIVKPQSTPESSYITSKAIAFFSKK